MKRYISILALLFFIFPSSSSCKEIKFFEYNFSVQVPSEWIAITSKKKLNSIDTIEIPNGLEDFFYERNTILILYSKKNLSALRFSIYDKKLSDATNELIEWYSEDKEYVEKFINYETHEMIKKFKNVKYIFPVKFIKFKNKMTVVSGYIQDNGRMIKLFFYDIPFDKFLLRIAFATHIKGIEKEKNYDLDVKFEIIKERINFMM